MAKIIHISPGAVLPASKTRPTPPRKEVVLTVTPNPKTKAQRKANDKAKRLQATLERQQAGGHENAFKSQAKAQRRRSAKLHNTSPDAKKELATRRSSSIS
jgi:hypothetical protein